METPTLDIKKLALARLEKRYAGGHYAVVERNPELMQELMKRLEKAAISGQTISYAQWVQDLELVNNDEERVGLTPPWKGEVERGMNHILEFIALGSLSKHGFMVTALVVYKSGDYAGYPSEQFSVVWFDLLGSNYDPHGRRKVVSSKHRKLADAHKKKVFEHCVASVQPAPEEV